MTTGYVDAVLKVGTGPALSVLLESTRERFKSIPAYSNPYLTVFERITY
jgi:hypothetical protein